MGSVNLWLRSKCAKPVARVGLLLASMLLFSSCEYSAGNVYQHVPSEKFYKSWDFSADYLSSSTTNNILFVTRTHSRGGAQNHDGAYISNYVIWLDLFTASPGRSVFIHKAKIKGADKQLTETINAEFHMTLDVKNSNFTAASVRLLEAREDTLDGMRNEDETLTLEVSYLIDGVSGVMDFALVLRPQVIGTVWGVFMPYKATVYQHVPSEKFYESRDLSANYLSPFTADDIVFVASVASTGFAERTYYIRKHTIRLGLYALAPGGQSVFIHEAKIKGADRQLAKSLNTELNVISKSGRNPDWTRAGLDLFDIREDKLEEMMLDNDGKLTLEVSYTINGVFSVMSFTLVRRIEKGLSWIT